MKGRVRMAKEVLLKIDKKWEKEENSQEEEKERMRKIQRMSKSKLERVIDG